MIDALFPDISEADRAEIVEIVLPLSSSTALFEFIDVLEVDVECGEHLAARAVRSLIEVHR